MHIKYRPKTWEQIIGNIAVKKALHSKKNSRPVLLYGTRGCGKTTIVHLLANQFGASEEEIKVINCIEHSGVDEMREELALLRRSSLFGEQKVLILDEVHGLSPKALNLFLVPLDGESKNRLPDNVLVLACTTEQDKLPKMMFERFLTYPVKPLTEEESLILLKYVTEKENIKLQKWKKALLVSKLEGNPRRLLVGLAKVKDCETEEEVSELLDVVSMDEDPDILELFKVYRSAGEDHRKKVLAKLLKTKSPSAIRVGMMNIISGYLMSNFNDGSSDVLHLYKYLQEAEGFPEKANIVYAIMRK